MKQLNKSNNKLRSISTKVALGPFFTDRIKHIEKPFSLLDDKKTAKTDLILVKGVQRYQRSKLKVKENICRLASSTPMCPRLAKTADILFDLQL